MSDIVVHDIQTPDDDADALLVLVGHNGPTPPFSGHKEMAAERQNSVLFQNVNFDLQHSLSLAVLEWVVSSVEKRKAHFSNLSDRYLFLLDNTI